METMYKDKTMTDNSKLIAGGIAGFLAAEMLRNSTPLGRLQTELTGAQPEAPIPTPGNIGSGNGISPLTLSDGVWYDNNSAYAGVDDPIGTPQCPVNNLPDLRAILIAKNLKRIYICDGALVDLDQNMMGYEWIGVNAFNVDVGE
jgi:hypothetical protein